MGRPCFGAGSDTIASREHYVRITEAQIGEAITMKNRTLLLAPAIALMLNLTSLQASAQASPRGWQCSYSIAPRLNRSPIYFACFGRSLKETRARARADCNRRASCNTGACLPLNYTPRQTCGRE